MTHIEQILGQRCMYKERQPFDKCRECTGYRCFAKEIQCENYVSYSRQTKQGTKISIGESDNSVVHIVSVSPDKTADTFKYRKLCMKTQDIVDKIRRANDGDAI